MTPSATSGCLVNSYSTSNLTSRPERFCSASTGRSLVSTTRWMRNTPLVRRLIGSAPSRAVEMAASLAASWATVCAFTRTTTSAVTRRAATSPEGAWVRMPTIPPTPTFCDFSGLTNSSGACAGGPAAGSRPCNAALSAVTASMRVTGMVRQARASEAIALVRACSRTQALMASTSWSGDISPISVSCGTSWYMTALRPCAVSMNT